MIKILSKNIIWLIIIFYVAICGMGLFCNFSLNTVGDESVIMSNTLKMINDHSLRPNYDSLYHMPLAVYIYLPFYILLFVFIRLSGLFTSLEDIKRFVILDYAKLLPLARCINILLGAISIYLVYKIAEKLFGNKIIGYISAFLLSTSLLFIQNSHTGNIWIPQVMTILLAFYSIVGLYEKNSAGIKDYLLTAFFIGISFGIHFIGLLIYISFFTVHLLKNKGKKFFQIIFHKNFWLANLLIIFFIPFLYYLNPHGFLNYTGGLIPTFDYIAPTAHQTVQADNASSNLFIKLLAGQSYFAVILWQYEPFLIILFLIGSVCLFIKKRGSFYIVFSFIVLYFLAINLIGGKIKYILPMVPFLAIVAAFGFYEAGNKMIKNNKARIAIGTILLSIFAVMPIIFSCKLILPGTRLSAREWINNNIPSGANLIVMDKALNLVENKEAIADNKKYLPDNYLVKHKFLETLADDNYPHPNYYILPLTDYYRTLPPQNLPPAEIAKKKYDYIIFKWWNKDDFETQMDLLRATYQQEVTLIKRFPENATAETENYDLQGWLWHPYTNLLKVKFVGPVVDVYKVVNK